MSDPRRKELARETVAAAAIFGISTGLCGATAYGIRYSSNESFWFSLGIVELIGMVIGAMKLLICAVSWLILWIQSFTNKEKP